MGKKKYTNLYLKLFDKFANDKYEVPFTSGLLYDEVSNEIIFFYKKQEYFSKTRMITYLGAIRNKVKCLLYNQDTNSYYVYDESISQSWTLYKETNWYLFSFFNFFIPDDIDSMTTIIGKVIPILRALKQLGIDIKPKNKYILTYTETNNFLYNRCLRDEIVTYTDLCSIYIKQQTNVFYKSSINIKLL